MQWLENVLGMMFLCVKWPILPLKCCKCPGVDGKNLSLYCYEIEVDLTFAHFEVISKFKPKISGGCVGVPVRLMGFKV